MIKAIFLDLDNTLIQNEDLPFAVAFLDTLTAFGVRALGTADLAVAFPKGMKALKAPRLPEHNNHALIVQTIADNLARQTSEIEKALDAFYAEDFPSLRSCVTPQPHAAELIEALLGLDYRIILATNPFYPLAAVHARLTWGDLARFIPEFEFISHAGNMHFVKPDAAYFAEIVARAGVEPDEVVMLGDSHPNDIVPARTIGMATFHIGNDGDLEDFQHFMEAHRDNFQRPALEPDMIEPQLRGNVGALYGLIDGLNPDYWHQHPDPEEWSPIQVVCHLADSETSVQRTRLQTIMQKDNPFLAQPRTPPGPTQFFCADVDGNDIAHRFAVERQHTINWLATLSEGDWARPARHSIFGPTTLLEMAQFTAQHDRLHIEQLCQTIGRCV